MTKAEQYQNMIFLLNDWFNKKIESLQVITNEDNDKKILFEGAEGEKVELPDDLKKGFYLGVKTAIEIFGDFPVKITKSK